MSNGLPKHPQRTSTSTEKSTRPSTSTDKSAVRPRPWRSPPVRSGRPCGRRHYYAPSDVNLPFTLQRTQFPIKLCYSMTINKAQGQSFQKLGIYLPKPVFSHGQLYVALSRSTSFNGIHIKVDKSTMQGKIKKTVHLPKMFVYPEIL